MEGLRLLIVILLTQTTSGTKTNNGWSIQPASNQSTFTTVGRLIEGVTFAYLQANLDPREDETRLHEAIEVLEEARRRKIDTDGLVQRGKALLTQHEELTQALGHAARAPRQVMATAAVGLVGTAAAYFVSQVISSTSRVTHLEDEMKTMTYEFSAGKDHAANINGCLVTMRQAMKKVSNKVSTVQDTYALREAAEDLFHRVGARISAMFQLLNGRLGPQALELTHAEAALAQLIDNRRTSTGEHLTPVYPDIRSVLMSDVVTVVDHSSGNLTVVFPVPMYEYPHGNSWTLQKRLPEPIVSDNQTFEVILEEDLLATRPDDGVFLELRSEELLQCRRFQGDHLCAKKFPQRTASNPGCLTTLYLSSATAGLHCGLQRLTRTRVTSLTEDSYSIFTSDPGAEFMVRCRDQRLHGSILIKGLQTLKLEPTCTAQSAEFRLEAGPRTSPEPVRTRTGPLPRLKLPNKTRDDEWDKIQEVLDKKIHHLKTADPLGRQVEGLRKQQLAALVVVIAVVTLTLLLGYGVARRMHARQEELAQKLSVLDEALATLRAALETPASSDTETSEDEELWEQASLSSSEHSHDSNPSGRPRPTRLPGKTPPSKRQRTRPSPKDHGERAAAAAAAAAALAGAAPRMVSSRTTSSLPTLAQTPRTPELGGPAREDLRAAPRVDSFARRAKKTTDTPTRARRSPAPRPRLLLANELKQEQEEIEMTTKAGAQSGSAEEPSAAEIGAAYLAALKKK